MRITEADGSITAECPVCAGSGNKGSLNMTEPCEGIGCNKGRIVVAPAGFRVTDESPVVEKRDNYRDRLEVVGMAGPIVDGVFTHQSNGIETPARNPGRNPVETRSKPRI